MKLRTSNVLVLSVASATLGNLIARETAADVIVLKDGRRLEGVVTNESADRLHVDTPDGLVIVDRKDVQQKQITARPGPKLDPAEQKRIRKLIGTYSTRVRAIKNNYLDVRRSSKGDRLFAEGRKRILAFDDPLVIGPLTRLLSDGSARTRRLLVEALSRFDDDEATMNLVVIAVLDPSEDVRRQAALVLLGRPDPRVIDDLRMALKSDEDEVVRNAAVALGILRAREVAPDLVDLLSFTRRMTVTVPRGELIASIQGSYIAGIRYRVAPGVAQAEPIIGTISAGSAIADQPVRIRGKVTVYRTEVQEALIAITGQNFGFDEEAWRIWLALNPPSPSASGNPGTRTNP